MIRNYVRSFIYAVRPFETMEHFAMTVAGFTFSAYLSGSMNFTLKGLLGAGAVICFLFQVLSYNNYATFDEDMQDENKKFKQKFRGINKHFIFWVSVVFFAGSVVLSVFVNLKMALILVLLMLSWTMYTHPIVMLKRGRFLPYFFDMITMPFLFLVGSYLNGYADYRCVLFSVFFGLTEIAGHLNHMTMDYEIDRSTEIRTLAVQKGPKFTFILSTVFFIAAPVYFTLLGILNIIPLWISMIFIPGAIVHSVKFVNRIHSFRTRDSVSFRTLYRSIYLIEALVLEIYMLIHIGIYRILL